MKAVRATLDILYLVSGVLASISLIAILLLIVVQMVARWTGEVFPGAAAYAGYAMAAASFLAFANALNKGAHIRVSIVLNAVGPKAKRVIDTWCFAVAALIAWYFVFHAQKFVYWSWKFNEISQDQDKTMLWIPQSIMLTGAVIFAIALTDHLLHLVFTGNHRINRESGQTSFEV